MPVLRTRYDMRTGFSPNNPRQQVQWMYFCNLASFAGSDAKKCGSNLIIPLRETENHYLQTRAQLWYSFTLLLIQLNSNIN